MAEQGGHKVGRETRLGFGLVSWSFDYESAATISQHPRPPPSLLTTACATTTTTYWSVLCRQATTQIQLPASLIVLVAEPRKRPGKEEGGGQGEVSASSGRWRRHPMKHETLAHLQQFRLFFCSLVLFLIFLIPLSRVFAFCHASQNFMKWNLLKSCYGICHVSSTKTYCRHFKR